MSKLKWDEHSDVYYGSHRKHVHIGTCGEGLTVSVKYRTDTDRETLEVLQSDPVVVTMECFEDVDPIAFAEHLHKAAKEFTHGK